MKNIKKPIYLLVASLSSLQASSILAPLGTPTTETPDNVDAPGVVMDNTGATSLNYLVGFLSDPTVSWDQTDPNGFGNPNNIAGTQLRVTASDVVGTGRIVFNPKAGDAGGNTIALALLDGGISSFKLTFEYLNAAGNPTGMTGLPHATDDVATPIMQVTNIDAGASDLGLSLLDINGTSLTNDFIAGSGVTGGVTHIVSSGSTLTNTAGSYNYSLANQEGLNMQRLATTPTDESDDIYSSISLTFDSNDADGIFDHNAKTPSSSQKSLNKPHYNHTPQFIP